LKINKTAEKVFLFFSRVDFSCIYKNNEKIFSYKLDYILSINEFKADAFTLLIDDMKRKRENIFYFKIRKINALFKINKFLWIYNLLIYTELV
jgi:hypothetical protein